MLYVIHLAETDGDIVAHPCVTREEVKLYLSEEGLLDDTYLVIEGDLLDI